MNNFITLQNIEKNKWFDTGRVAINPQAIIAMQSDYTKHTTKILFSGGMFLTSVETDRSIDELVTVFNKTLEQKHTDYVNKNYLDLLEQEIDIHDKRKHKDSV